MFLLYFSPFLENNICLCKYTKQYSLNLALYFIITRLNKGFINGKSCPLLLFNMKPVYCDNFGRKKKSKNKKINKQRALTWSLAITVKPRICSHYSFYRGRLKCPLSLITPF